MTEAVVLDSAIEPLAVPALWSGTFGGAPVGAIPVSAGQLGPHLQSASVR